MGTWGFSRGEGARVKPSWDILHPLPWNTRERSETRRGPSLPRQRLPPPPCPDFGGAPARRGESISGSSWGQRPRFGNFFLLLSPRFRAGRHWGPPSGTCGTPPPRAGGWQGLPSLPPLLPPAPGASPGAARSSGGGGAAGSGLRPRGRGSGRWDPERDRGRVGVAVARGRLWGARGLVAMAPCKRRRRRQRRQSRRDPLPPRGCGAGLALGWLRWVFPLPLLPSFPPTPTPPLYFFFRGGAIDSERRDGAAELPPPPRPLRPPGLKVRPGNREGVRWCPAAGPPCRAPRALFNYYRSDLKTGFPAGGTAPGPAAAAPCAAMRKRSRVQPGPGASRRRGTRGGSSGGPGGILGRGSGGSGTAIQPLLPAPGSPCSGPAGGAAAARGKFRGCGAPRGRGTARRVQGTEPWPRGSAGGGGAVPCCFRWAQVCEPGCPGSAARTLVSAFLVVLERIWGGFAAVPK